MSKRIDGAEEADSTASTPDRLAPRVLSLAAKDGMRVGQPARQATRQRQQASGAAGGQPVPAPGAPANPYSGATAQGAADRAGKQGLWIDRFLEKTEKAAARERAARVEPPVPKAGILPNPLVPAGAAAPGATPAPPPSRPEPVVPATPDEPLGAFAHQLIAMPDDVDMQLRRIAMLTDIPDDAVRACWQALEHNTHYLSGQWDYVLPTQPLADLRHDADTEPSSTDVVLLRFWDICPVRATAVPDRIRTARNGTASVLNANRMPLHGPGQLIASQKPVAGEVRGFQQMLVDEDVALVVDLTRLTEREPRALYAPELAGLSLNSRDRKLVITCDHHSVLQEIGAIAQSLTIDDGARMHAVKRLRFPHWPDHGVIGIDTLIALADRVEAIAGDPARAVLVHCRAGVGRTGTLMSFMSARSVLTALQCERKDRHTPEAVLRAALAVVAKGRACRGPGFVQVEAQFHLLVQALARTFLQALPAVHPTHPRVPPGGDFVPNPAPDQLGYSVLQRLHGRLLYLRQKLRRLTRPPTS